MTHTRLKLTVAGLAIAIAVALLAVSGIREGWVYYLQVDQFLDDDSYHSQRVRLHGTVGDDNFESNGAELTAGFELLGETQRLHVQYTGIIPDLFKAGQDVVVEGQLDDAGIFHADTMMTKCASKYESQDGEAPHADPRTGEAAG